jgi:diguanylate cyclase (GGDEF)-like protein/PAS domain S-box-containing protein
MFQASPEARSLNVNRSLAKMLGFDSVEETLSAVNNLIEDVWVDPDEHARFSRQIAEHGVVRGFECRFRRKDGAVIWVALNARRVCGADGRLLYHEGFIEDITERKKAEEALRESGDFLREAQRIGDLGCYVLDVPTEVWTSSDVLDGIFGIDKEYDRTVAGWTALIHPDDRAMMAAYFAEEVLGEGKAFNKEYRIVRQTDQEERWVHGMGRLAFDAQGKPLKMHGIIRDITERKLSEMKLRDSEERYRATFEQAAIGIVHASFEGRYLRCNARFAEIVGYPLEEIPGMTFQQITAPEDSVECETVRQRITGGEAESVTLEKRYLRKDGSLTWVKVTLSTQRDGEGRALHSIALVEDINARKAAEQRLTAAQEALRVSETRYRTVFQTSPDFVAITRISDGAYIDANKAFFDTSGFEPKEVIGRTSLELNIWADRRNRKRLVEMLRQNSSCRDLEVQFRRKSGELFWGLMSASVMDLDGVPCILSMTRDISDAKAAEDKIRNLAFYDSLTGLPNRRLLLERLRQTLASSAPDRRKQALLLVDLDNFKTLNDTLGHQTGDFLLQEAARRLSSCLGETDTVARLGGDEFAVILEDLSATPEDAAAQAQAAGERILATVSQSYLLAGRECRSTASIGITVFGDRQDTTDEVLQQADIALDQAKTAGRNAMRFFAPALQAAVNARVAMEEDLRQAIRTNQFVLYYQPQVDRAHLIGAEALIRWNHPKRGLLAPGEFIPMAEETGLILPLGDWVLETACTQIAAWADRTETAHIAVAVNISARQFRQPDFVQQVLAALDRTGADPQNLELELTESMLVENIEDVIAKMTYLKSHGLRFSLDDFGTGYSSLAYLKRLPLDLLKIDRLFVRDVLVDASSGAIAQTILSLSRAMGLPVIAEGVETEEQRNFLIRLGCHSFQGYLFSRPLPLREFETFLKDFAEDAAPVLQ